MKMITVDVLLWGTNADINADDIVMVEEVDKQNDFNQIAKEVSENAQNIEDENWQKEWLHRQEQKYKGMFEELPSNYVKIHFRSGGFLKVGNTKQDIYSQIKMCEVAELNLRKKILNC